MKYIDEKLSGERMKKIMDEKGISITEVSKRIGISYEAVSKWIKGKSFPEANNLFLLSRILDVAVDELVVPKKDIIVKLSVEQAFKIYGDIIIDYTFECHCGECGKNYDEVDEEYSFEGNVRDFEYHQKHYGVIDLDDELTQIKNNRFALYRTAPDDGVCSDCSDEE